MVVKDDNGGHKAYRVDHKFPGVGDKEEGREASGVANNPLGSCQGVGEGVELPQGNETPGVT